MHLSQVINTIYPVIVPTFVKLNSSETISESRRVKRQWFNSRLWRRNILWEFELDERISRNKASYTRLSLRDNFPFTRSLAPKAGHASFGKRKLIKQNFASLCRKLEQIKLAKENLVESTRLNSINAHQLITNIYPDNE